MSSIKHVFFENEPLMTTKKMYEDYSAACATEKGAIMFCVYRGKMSEGIDFKNELARAVICVGIPYPNTTSIQLNQHQKYHEEFSASKGIMTKSEWYSAQAFRALNQAIGRCIRHKDDWGSIIFLEERMVGPKLESISKWIHTRTRIYQTMDQLSNELKEFHQIQAARNVKLAVSDTTDPFTSVQDLS
jgi:Rad3-related DNA helicase